MRCEYTETKQCTHLDTSGMNQVVECNACPEAKGGVRTTGAIPILNISKTKILTIFALFSTIALVVVLLLLKLSERRINELKQTEQLYIHVQDTLKIVLNNLGQQTASIEVLESENTNLFTKLQTTDATIIRLQKVINLYEKKVGDLNSAIVINNETILELQDSIKNLIIGYSTDPTTPGITYPIYTRVFTKEWYSGDVTMGLTQLDLNIKIKNSYDITIGDEKVSLFKKKMYANITNLNPDTETKEMKVYQKEEVKTKIMTTKDYIEVGLGVFFGYLLFK